jgi:hypothetical protein
MPAEMDLIVASVTGALTGGVLRPLLAPADALAEHWKETIRKRLTVVSNAAARKRRRPLHGINERIAHRVLLGESAGSGCFGGWRLGAGFGPVSVAGAGVAVGIAV